ncbi:MAG: hypothetical protein M3Y66_05935 [Actinomycetota bacterium]|nr:hypothetical protein [Actinomycetota bacterium]
MTEQTKDELDPVILDAVQHVANRFGVAGLEDLIAVANRELTDARRALQELADAGEGETAADVP